MGLTEAERAAWMAENRERIFAAALLACGPPPRIPAPQEMKGRARNDWYAYIRWIERAWQMIWDQVPFDFKRTASYPSVYDRQEYARNLKLEFERWCKENSDGN